MIKKEWLTPRNGFAVGEKVLYINPAFLHESMVFCLKSLDLELVTVPGRKDPIWKGVMESGHYGSPVYLEPEGCLYPVESRQFAFWNPFHPETGVFPYVMVHPANVGQHPVSGKQESSMSQVVQYTSDSELVGRQRVHGVEIVDRPDWAEGLKL